jgi:hypothetical protein
MSQSPKHLILELGVLKSISIGKRSSPDKIRSYKEKIKKIAKSKKEEEELLRKAIQKDVEKMIDPSKIPGIILDISSQKRQIAEKRLIDLTYFASIVSKKAIEKNLKKFDLCYLINSLVNMLELDENDFEKFRKKFNKFKTGEIDSPEDGGDEPDWS